jgi:hypothetical protein
MTFVERNNLGPQRRLGAYIGHISSSIITYLHTETNTTFTDRSKDYVFYENIFPQLHIQSKTTTLKFTDNLEMPIMQDRMTDECDRLVQELLSIRHTPHNQLLKTASDPHNKKHDHNKFKSTTAKNC